MQARLDVAPSAMSREVYGSSSVSQRSPKPSRRPEPPASGSKYYPSSISQPVSGRGSPVRPAPDGSAPRRSSRYGSSRSGNASPLPAADVPHSASFSAQHYYGPEEPTSPSAGMDRSGGGHHRSRSATRVPLRNYHSLERDQEREFVPIRDPRDRSLDRAGGGSGHHPRSRERSLDRSGYRERDDYAYSRDMDAPMESDPYRDTSHRTSGHGGSYGDSGRHSYGGSSRTAVGAGGGGDGYSMELQSRLNDLQAQYSNLKRELDATTQKLGSSMHSIKTFWSPELKKERALRKEEAAKYALINDQLKILRSENQKQAALIRQLEEELRISHLRNPDAEVQQHLEALYTEKEHMTKEIFLLRETIKELELRIETQKQTLAARDESIKKLMEIKGVGGKIMEEDRLESERVKSKLFETEARYRHVENMLESREKELNKMEELRIELNRRDQEIMAMNAKMKTLEEQHHDYQRHIAVLKESLCAKEEHYNMLQADVEELRIRLEEKNKLIEKKTQQTMTASQERNRLTQEVQELRDHMEIKDRKVNVLQRKIENLEDLLKEKDNQVDMARARLTAMQAHHSSSEGALSSLEEAIGDKEKQISQLRDQRDRAEQERNEERELHERELAEHRLKMHALESEMEKLQLQDPQKPDTAAMRKQIDEKQARIDEMEKRMLKLKEKIKELESKPQQKPPSNNESQVRLEALEKLLEELSKEKEKSDKEVAKSKEDAKRLQAELDRLLDVMTVVEKEKFALNEQIRELTEAMKEKETKVQAAKRGQQADRNKNAQMLEEARRRESEVKQEATKAQEQVLQQQERIEELEEALRESVRITAQREVAVAERQSMVDNADEKIRNLQSELRGLQKGINARCTSCPELKVKLIETDKKLKVLISERKLHLEQLFEMKQEALSATISEKDSHLAFLEMSGIKNAKTAEQVDKLKAEKKRLMDKMKIENEKRVKLLMDLEDSDLDNKKFTSINDNDASQDAEEDGLRSLS